MPLHRVYETVNPKPEVFDVIIVDEASQCGPEGLPLTFLAKKLIVVGDDQQISPEAVGIKQDQVQSLREEYLYDFEHADAFVLWGANMAEMHPVLWQRLTNRRLSYDHVKVAVLSTYEHRCFNLADLGMIFNPQSDLAILNLSNVISETLPVLLPIPPSAIFVKIPPGSIPRRPYFLINAIFL